MVSDKEITQNYERWFLTREGMYTDDKEKELLINAMRFKRGERVLEIGCGTGRNVEYFTDLGLDATGVEPVDELVKIARQKSSIKKEQIIRAPYDQLPLGDNTFDNVVFMNTFAFAGDKEKALKEAFRVASKKVGIGFLNKYSLTNLLKVKERRAVYQDAAPFSGKEMEELAKKTLSGWEKEREITVRYTLFLPIKIGYLVPFVDDVMEKTNLPFGDFGVLVIKKLKIPDSKFQGRTV
jgi:ubiquinone/menaquinone biosynthesis C-methylase UbiE